MATPRQELLIEMSNSFGQLKRAMHIFGARDYSKLGLSLAQLVLLKAINSLQPVSHKRLAQYMQMTPGAITQLLDALDETDCIIRIANESDRRVSYLSVSRHGKQVLQQFKKMHIQTLSKACADSSDDDLAAYTRVQHTMINWLESQTRKD